MNVKVISDREILQRADRQDACIQRIQVIEIDGKRTEVRFWYQGGKLHHIDSVAA